MAEHEHTVTCRERHPVKFSRNDEFPFQFSVERADKDLGVLAERNIYTSLKVLRFRCIDCSIVFSCEVTSYVPPVPEIAEILKNHTVAETQQILRERVFGSLDLEPYFPPPGEIKF